MVHSKTRALVETLYTEGLSISYDRVMKIRSSISSQICGGYREIGFVCPPTLHENLFTSAAIDNIDHNLTSTTATSSIHWTGISIFQHPDGAVEHKALNYRVKSDINDKLKLPHSYTDIQPMKTGKPEPMVLAIAKDEMEFSVLEEANDWIEALASETPAGAVTFAAFYSRLQTQAPLKSLDALLPLIPESVNSHAVVRHCMMQVKKITNTLNPQQRPVITADQPVYALCKQVQLMCPKEFGALLL